MDLQWKNDDLQVTVAQKGAQLQSVLGTDGTEYIWQTAPDSWGDRALNIFPYVARLTNGRYIWEGKTYEMEPHGFAPTAQYQVDSPAENRRCFTLTDDAQTQKSYPRHFVYQVDYRLDHHTLHITYRVKNTDEKELIFGLGGHPGFCLPLERGRRFDDYLVEFAHPEQLCQVGMSEDCFVTGETVSFPLQEGKYLHLNHRLFDHDAIILQNAGGDVTLRPKDGAGHGVQVVFPQMPFLGLWTWPAKDSDYLCIEPWLSLPSRKGVVEDFATQPHLYHLSPGQIYENTWSVRFF